MRSKSILSIAAFVIAFSGSVALASLFGAKAYRTDFSFCNYTSNNFKARRYQTETARQITVFINNDINNGYARDRKIYSRTNNFRPAFESSVYPAYAGAVEEYVDNSSNMAAESLPGDFQNAWNEHMQAWRDYSEFLNDMKSSSVRKTMDMDELLNADNEYSREINRTWYEVLRTGKTYGANVY